MKGDVLPFLQSFILKSSSYIVNMSIVMIIAFYGFYLYFVI